jgi:L-aminopeptidase/D-esterase-like protein
MNNTLTAISGIMVGHASDFEHGTGCTVVLCEGGAKGGIDICGTATGSRELLTLDPLHSAERLHAICLAGGSAYGLGAADGVMRWLEERGIGYRTSVAVVPIVPAAIIFDLSFKDKKVRPDPEMGYRACQAASEGPVEEGSVGVGTGATVGKLLLQAGAMKSGVGSYCLEAGDGTKVAALVVVNNFGDVLDFQTGKILAGCRDPDTGKFLDVAQTLARMDKTPEIRFGENTNLAVVATDAKLSKPGATKLAQMAQAGLARTLSPAHSTFDGDVIFAISVGQRQSEINKLGILAGNALAEAVNRAVEKADGLGALPALKDLK